MRAQSFPSIGLKPVGLYPIVSNAAQLEQLLPIGVRIIQLRIKDRQDATLAYQIQRSVRLAKRYHTKLFINDYWELAAASGAYGVHLGQTDLVDAPVDKLRTLGLRLGVSAYSDAELARALALKPSYIAYGPIFTTPSKQIDVPAQGVDKLRAVRQLVNCPLVAIGGIGLTQLHLVLACHVDGIAVISAISHALNPIQAAKTLRDIIDTTLCSN
jgi:hydroxymethylpyrimidine kinase/phosphomethylpyrimidine kinase/thiamine-phosphate diphosphorylase